MRHKCFLVTYKSYVVITERRNFLVLQIKNITKIYKLFDTYQAALKGVNVNFRENEFVSILGPSGSGKTTLLNIIGGLDRYSDGDLIINGVSTKEYNDADWDTYRNHSIGFIFQNYNLIPHQTVLSNVEMALTLSGVSKKERKTRAIEVLEKVGLSDHIHKKPNQMSGGQMQRVAIARALINNPDILLADEPTGALDSETSVQIMDLLKEIANDKLVIMVTHNPELAEKYSTRIVNLLDGQIISDSDPYDISDEVITENSDKNKKVSMSFLTALSLSFNNLKTKKGRTLLTAFAGSIGIIGIALILSLSTGMSSYIDDIQKNTMEAYPITIGTESFDLMSFGMQGPMQSMEEIEKTEEKKKRTAVYADYSAIERKDTFTSSFKSNNLTDFKKYLDNPESRINEYLGENGIVYTYDVKFSAFSYNKDKKLIDSDTEIEDEEESPSFFSGFGKFFSGGKNETATNFSQMLKGADNEVISSIVTDNYDMIYGSWPEKYNEVVLVLNRENSISAKKLYQLGLITEEQYDNAVKQIESGKDADDIILKYKDICEHTFYMVPACDLYFKNENGTFTKIDDYKDYEEELTTDKVELKIVGIIRPMEESENTTISTTIAYTSLLTDYIIEYTEKSDIVSAQKKTPKINVLSGTKFEASTDKEKIGEAKNYIKALDETGKANLYRMMILSGNSDTEATGSSFSIPNIPSIPVGAPVVNTTAPVLPTQPTTSIQVKPTLPATTTPATTVPATKVPTTDVPSSEEATTDVITTSPEQAIIAGQQEALSQAQATIDKQQGMLSQAQSAIAGQQSALSSAQQVIAGQQSALVQSQAQLQMMAGVLNQIKYAMNEMASMTEESKLAEKMDEWLEDSADEEMLLTIYDQYIGEATYDDNLSEFGLISYDAPSSISIYTDSYEDKDMVAACIEEYNSKQDEDSKITYTDYIALITSSVTTIINGISYVLIAFVAISLVVSCIMIGIITHISVMERTKEIGILRALGASKSNISQVFNAETFIIGCCSGLIGIFVSLLSLYPINTVIALLTDISDLNAKLPFGAAVILIIISIIITIIGGLIPSRKAAKKDPVVALRTE